MSYTIARFDKSMLSLLPRPQEPFEIIGKLVPIFDGHEWKISEELFDNPYEKTYPDDMFDPMTYIDNPNEAAFLAMFDGKCIGSLRVGKRWNSNAFVDDLAIDMAHRGKGVGTMLMDAAVNWGKEMGLYGISLETQNLNLHACRFYLKYGFKLGGIDRYVYTNKDYRDEIALYLYILPR